MKKHDKNDEKKKKKERNSFDKKRALNHIICFAGKSKGSQVLSNPQMRLEILSGNIVDKITRVPTGAKLMQHDFIISTTSRKRWKHMENTIGETTVIR